MPRHAQCRSPSKSRSPATKANYLLHNRQPRQFDKMGLAKDCFELAVRTRNGNLSTVRSEISSWMTVRTLVSKAKSRATRQPVFPCQSSHKTSCNRILERFLFVE